MREYNDRASGIAGARVELEGRARRTGVENGRHEGKRVEEAESRTRARVMYCSHLRQALRASSAILRWCTTDYTRLRALRHPAPYTCTPNCRLTWMHARIHRAESRYAPLKRSPASPAPNLNRIWLIEQEIIRLAIRLPLDFLSP